MSNAIVPLANEAAEIIERVMLLGDLSRLTPEERVMFYQRTCESIGLNPMTRPFDYLNLKGKLVLYAKKDCTEQLRQIHGVSVYRIEKERQDDLYVVTAYARDKYGREDSDIGIVLLGNLRGEDLANAMMKAVTKAKRRVTLSICGLGMPDESEIETIRESAIAVVADDGRIIDKGKIEKTTPPRTSRNSDPEYVKPDPELDPLTGRPYPKPRAEHEDGTRMNTATQVDEKLKRDGLISFKGWMAHCKLDVNNRNLRLHMLNYLGNRGGDLPYWNTSKELTSADWKAIGKGCMATTPERAGEVAQAYIDSMECIEDENDEGHGDNSNDE